MAKKPVAKKKGKKGKKGKKDEVANDGESDDSSDRRLNEELFGPMKPDSDSDFLGEPLGKTLEQTGKGDGKTKKKSKKKIKKTTAPTKEKKHKFKTTFVHRLHSSVYSKTRKAKKREGLLDPEAKKAAGEAARQAVQAHLAAAAASGMKVEAEAIALDDD